MTQKTLEESPLYGARTIMRFKRKPMSVNSSRFLEQLSILNQHAFQELISNDDLKPHNILEALKESKNQTLANHYKPTPDNLDFNFFQRSEFTYEKQQYFRRYTRNDRYRSFSTDTQGAASNYENDVLCRGGKRTLTSQISKNFSQILYLKKIYNFS